MADELNPDVSVEKTTFISSLNEDAPPFDPSQQQQRSSTEDASYLLNIPNGDQTNHHENSSNIQSTDPSENNSTETHFIEETTTAIDENPTSPSHIESVTSSSNDGLEQSSISESEQHEESSEIDGHEQINEISLEQSNHFNNHEELNTLNAEEQSNTFNDDQINTSNDQDDSKLLLEDHDTSNTQTNFEIQSNIPDKPDELKAQRELDEDEIPPVELPTDQKVIHIETSHSSTESETDIVDDRPLTELETPYAHHHENETNGLSSLPDVVTETLEPDQGDVVSKPIELEKLLFEELPVKNENIIEETILPPLPPTSIALEQELETESTDLNKEEQEPLLLNTESVPSEPEDVLGNKTLLKQTIDKGTVNTRPTRSTMATVSYTLSLVDNLTSNVRVIETVSNETFFLSECDIFPAIDICVQLMDRGEHALIDSDIRHCYGEIGCEEKQIPPVSSNNSYRMKIDLELHDWKTPADVQTLSIEERLNWGDKKRQMGNFYYRRQEHLTSLQCYRGALRFLDTDDNPILIPFDESQRSILNDHYIQVQNNVAQVNLHLNKYDACLNAVENVLKHDPKNVKALYRQGKALFELGKYDQAIQPLRLFNQIQRGNSNAGSDKDKVSEMISVCETKLADYQKNEKEIYRRMFQPTTTTPTPNQQRQTKTINQANNDNTWWPYIALGSAALAAVGVAVYIKHRKVL